MTPGGRAVTPDDRATTVRRALTPEGCDVAPGPGHVFSSTIIPTVGRPSLARAVESVLDQDFDAAGFEVIVVNDSGRPLPAEAWQSSPRVRILHTARAERSIARNAGARVARGAFLHFLDDDDALLPGALAALWALHLARPDAAWLYGGYRNVDNDGAWVAEFRPELDGDILAPLVAGEGIPFQGSLLRATSFADVGGFDPAQVGTEDRDVGRALSMACLAAHTPALVAVIRVGQVGSTTDWSRLAELDRQGREKILRRTGAGRRLRSSAVTPYWRGRLVRAYAGSVLWNLRRQAWPEAMARLAGAVESAMTPRLWRRGFWRGLRQVR
ncbi:MAG: glycosyltransferase [Vicinamibacterales bacterium]